MKAGTDGRELQQKIDMYSDMLFKLSYIRLQNVQDAEDVVQEVFYQYIRHSQPFESPEHEKAWLLKVTLNTCRKVWRSAWRRHRDVLVGAEGEKAGGDSIEESDLSSYGLSSEPEEVMFRQEEHRRIMNAVLALPEKYRDVIHLFYYEELSVKEIARYTGRGISTVTSQLTRGRELLKKSLGEEYEFE